MYLYKNSWGQPPHGPAPSPHAVAEGRAMGHTMPRGRPHTVTPATVALA
jgi:hypothetical protein